MFEIEMYANWMQNLFVEEALVLRLRPQDLEGPEFKSFFPLPAS